MMRVNKATGRALKRWGLGLSLAPFLFLGYSKSAVANHSDWNHGVHYTTGGYSAYTGAVSGIADSLLAQYVNQTTEVQNYSVCVGSPGGCGAVSTFGIPTGSGQTYFGQSCGVSGPHYLAGDDYVSGLCDSPWVGLGLAGIDLRGTIK